MGKKATQEEETAVECSIDLADGLEFDLANHEKAVAAETAVEAKDVKQPVKKDMQQPVKKVQDDGGEGFQGLINRKCVILCALLIVILILAIILPIYFTMSSKSESEPASTAAPTSALSAELVEILLPYTPEETLLDPSTPQGQALLELMAEVEASGEDPNSHRVKQRYALMVLYLSTTPDGWGNFFGWKGFEDDECSWYGVSTCRLMDDGSYAVTNIVLNDNGLGGELPTEICALSENLEKIGVSGNDLEGQIPMCLSDFVNLSEVDMSGNKIGGNLPTGLLAISTMEIIDFSVNQIGGDIANLFSSGGDATGLTTVLLQDNLLTGAFPIEVEGYPALSEFRVHNNTITGAVSDTTCSLQDGTFLATLSADCASGEVTCSCCSECV